MLKIVPYKVNEGIINVPYFKEVADKSLFNKEGGYGKHIFGLQQLYGVKNIIFLVKDGNVIGWACINRFIYKKYFGNTEFHVFIDENNRNNGYAFRLLKTALPLIKNKKLALWIGSESAYRFYTSERVQNLIQNDFGKHIIFWIEH